MFPLDRSTWPFDVESVVSRPEMSPLIVMVPVVVVTVVVPPALLRPRIVTAAVKPAVTLPAPELTDVKFVTDMLPAGSDAPVEELTIRLVAVIRPLARFTEPVFETSWTGWPGAEMLALTWSVPVVEIVIDAAVVVVGPEMVSVPVFPVNTRAPDVLLIWRLETARPDMRLMPALADMTGGPAVRPPPLWVICDPAPVTVIVVEFVPLFTAPAMFSVPDVWRTIAPLGLETPLTARPPPSLMVTFPDVEFVA